MGDNFISKRLIIIINLLIEDYFSIKELQDKLYIIFEKEFYHRDIKKDIKKLQDMGFNIHNTKKGWKEGVKYKILDTPIKYNISEYEKDILLEIYNPKYKDFFDKLEKILNINLNLEEFDNRISNLKYEKKFYADSRKIFFNAKKDNKKVSFNYFNPSTKEIRNHSGFLYDINIDNKKVDRFILYNEENKKYLEFNIERIEPPLPKIFVNEKMTTDFFPYIAKFKIFYPVNITYHLDKGEKIIEKNQNYYIIQTRYISDFRLIQKVLKYGANVEILEPFYLREQMKELFLKALKNY